MTKIITLFVIVSFVLTVISSLESKKYKDDDNATQRFVTANMALTGRYLYERLRKYPDLSYTIGTLPLCCTLGHLAYHTQGEEYDRIINILGLKNKDEIKKVLLTEVSRVIESDVTSKLTFKVFGDYSEKFTKSYKQDFIDICNGESGYVDYDSPEEALDDINEWFANQTAYTTFPITNYSEIYNNNDKKGVVYTTSMDYLYNLDHPNNPRGFIDIDFQVSENETLVFPSMYGNGYFKYGQLDDLDAQVLRIDLNGGLYYGVIYYPNNPDNLLKLVEKIQDPKVFFGGLDRSKWMCLRVHITIGFANVANDLMEFVPKLQLDSTNLKTVFKSGNPAHVNYVVQQLHFIQAEVENGQLNSERCPGDDLPFVKMNHPYAYYVMASNGLNVCAGILNGLQSYGL